VSRVFANIMFRGFIVKSMTASTALAAAIASVCMSTQANAQTRPADQAPQQNLNSPVVDEIIVTGTRREDRTVTQSATPIDVFTAEDFLQQGTSDTNSLFQALVPAFSVPQASISSGSSFVRPPNLRGLPPDQTLVLLNGKRRHRSALVNIDVSAMSVLSQAVDLAQIPAIAIERVEVLRDGASAQYGSDAIAGVINISLKREPSELISEARYGQYYAGDGADRQLALNKGFQLGEEGFVNLSAEHVDSGATSRGTQRPGARQLHEEHPEMNIPAPVQHWGKTDIEAQRLFVNGATALGGSELYFFGNYGRSKGVENFNYRQPLSTTNFARTALYGVTYYLDQLPNGNYDSTGATYNYTQLFPDGFTPQFHGEVDDYAGTVGYRGKFANDLSYDISAAYGHDQLKYSIDDTLNPSFGPDTPTSFYLGKLEQAETNFNADFSYPVDMGTASPLNVAWGLEHRREKYQVGLGDTQSWAAGPFARQVVQRPDGSTFVVTSAVGSNGFGGFGPSNAGSAARESYAGYVDLETDITDAFSLGLAGRYEHFSDFGDTQNFKLSTRYEFLPSIAIRGAASTGFHAPTPGQTSVNNVLTSFVAGSTTPIQVGTFSVTHPAAMYFGAVPVKPEKAINLTAGIVITPASGTTLTLDYYNIRIRDRIGLSQAFSVTAADRAALRALGVENADALNQVQYLTNAFETRTEGVDAVFTNVLQTDGAGTFTTSIGANYNRTQVTERDPAIVSNDRVANLEHLLPQFRINASEAWGMGPFSLLVRVNYYDSFTVTATNGIAQEFGAEFVTDLEASYQLNKHFSVAAGVQNLFDNYPDKDRRSLDPVYGLPGNGNQYIDASPFGYNGGFWYTRASVTF
jgi:iron complex outermembrane recepter protein